MNRTLTNPPTHYHADTPATVRQLIDSLIHTGRRVRLFYGDSQTGRDWGEEHMVTGTIGRSTGNQPIPLMIASRHSMGGDCILCHCIVRLLVNGREVYRHPNYHQPAYTIGPRHPTLPKEYTTSVYANGANVANFRKESSARRWIQFMTGERMTP